MKFGVKIINGLYGALVGLGILGILGFIAICFLPVVAFVYGAILAFKASVILGIAAIFIEPACLVFGFVMLFGGVNIPEKIMQFLHHLQ